MERYDILSDADGELRIENNDLVYGLSDPEHIQDTIYAAPGWWKENFTDGVNIQSYLNSSGQEQVLCRAMKIQLQSDLYIVTNPSVKFTSDSKMVVNPNATI